MTDKEFFILLGTALAVMQFIYRMWDKQDNKTVMNAARKDTKRITHALEDGIESFAPHFDRVRASHGMLKELQTMHNVRDEDGRPMWYMPREMLETQRELVKITGILVNTQERQTALMEKLEEKLEMHREACRLQFTTLDKKTVRARVGV